MTSESASRVNVLLPIRTLVVASIVVAIAAALVSITDALLMVFVGVFLALVFEIPVRAFQRRTGWGRGKSAAIVVLVSAATVAVLALLLLVPLVSGLRDFLKALPDLVAELRESGELSWLGNAGGENVEDGATNLAEAIPESIGAILGVAGRAFSAGLAIFTILFLALFLLVDIDRLKRAFTSVLMPPSGERWLAVWERITRTVSAWAIGALVIAVIAGTVQGTTAWLVGSSYAIALGLIAGVLDLIPTIGATIAGFILVPTILAEEGLTAALIMLAVVLVYQQIENNLLTPTIQGRAVKVSGFLIMLGVTVFGALLGPLGALVAVPVMGSLQIVLGEVTKERRARVEEARAALGLPPANVEEEAEPVPGPDPDPGLVQRPSQG